MHILHPRSAAGPKRTKELGREAKIELERDEGVVVGDYTLAHKLEQQQCAELAKCDSNSLPVC